MLKKEFWKDWENNVLEIIRTALLELLTKDELPSKEDDISRIFAPILRRCRRNWCAKNTGEMEIQTPLYQVKGQPDEGHKEKQKKENKLAEFTWIFTDYQNDIDRNYAVECKNLKYPPSTNKYYVTDGLKRFVHKDWSYGIHSESGLMIGYVQSIKLQTVLNSINAYANEGNFPNLVLKGTWQKGGISELSHTLDRPDVPISPFRLEHFWIDLRKFYVAAQKKMSNND